MSRRFLLVGLTGGIATGKSTVSEAFRRLGCVIIDADVLAREVVEPGEPAYPEIVAEFGRDVLQPDGALDRKKLGALVFADADKRRRLEAITHPRIRERFLRRVQELADRDFGGIAIFDAAVMIESGNYKTMDRLVVVVADPASQAARLRARDGTDEAEGRRRIASQMPLGEKAKLADYVIDNSGDREATLAEVVWVHQSLMRELRASGRLAGSALPLAVLFFRHAAHYGRNPFDPSAVVKRLRDASPSLSWIAYHRSPPSATVVIRDRGAEAREEAESTSSQVTKLRSIARTFADLARLDRALPGDAEVTTRGKIVVGQGDRQRNVVVVLLATSVASGLRLVGRLNPRVEVLTWASDRDTVCLYDRPHSSGSNGQVERAVCASLAKGAGDGTKVVGTARAMSVIRDILDGTLERVERGAPSSADAG